MPVKEEGQALRKRQRRHFRVASRWPSPVSRQGKRASGKLASGFESIGPTHRAMCRRQLPVPFLQVANLADGMGRARRCQLSVATFGNHVLPKIKIRIP
jgi:hypothetical protein